MNRLLEIYAQDSGVPILRVAVLPSTFIGLLVMVNGFLFKWSGTRYLFEPDVYDAVTAIETGVDLASVGMVYCELDGYLYTVVYGGKVYKIHPTTGETTALSNSTSRNHIDIACKQSTGQLYISVDSSRIFEIDRITGADVRASATNRVFRGLDYCAITDKLYSAMGVGVIYSFNASNLAETIIPNMTPKSNRYGLCVCRKTGMLFNTVSNASIWRINPTTGEEVDLVVSASSWRGIECNPIDNMLYVTTQSAEEYRVDPTTGARVSLALGIIERYGVCYNSSNGMIYMNQLLDQSVINQINWTKLPA